MWQNRAFLIKMSFNFISKQIKLYKYINILTQTFFGNKKMQKKQMDLIADYNANTVDFEKSPDQINVRKI